MTDEYESQSEPINLNPILSPESNVEIYSDYVRVHRSSLLTFITEENLGGMAPLHRQQLIQLKLSYENKDYLSRSDFTLLSAVFVRYTEQLKERNSFDTTFLTNFTRALLESTTFENRITQLLKLQQEAAAKNEQGNFHLIAKPYQPSPLVS